MANENEFLTSPINNDGKLCWFYSFIQSQWFMQALTTKELKLSVSRINSYTFTVECLKQYFLLFGTKMTSCTNLQFCLYSLQ